MTSLSGEEPGSSSAVALAGRRLQLRPLVAEDAPALAEAAESSRELLRRWLDWAAAPLDARAELEFIQAATRGAESPVWGVFEGRTGRMAGVAALHRLPPSERGQARLGLWVRSDRQGRGYATEIVRLLVEHGLRRMGLHRISARIDPANRPARKVLKKAGFRYEGCLRDDRRAHGRWVDRECWGFLRGDLKR